MYGKSFASMYTGSMFGQPALVFAVWGYVLSNMRPDRKSGDCYVELNPLLLAPMFSETVDSIEEALDVLESEDPASRSSDHSGRRLILQSDGGRVRGPNSYLVVNGAKYRALRDEEERRAYMREAKRRSRASKKSKPSTAVKDSQPPSTQLEVEVKEEEPPPPNPPSGGNARRRGDSGSTFDAWRLAYARHYQARYGYPPTEGPKYGEHVSTLSKWSLEAGLNEQDIDRICQRFLALDTADVREAEHWIGWLPSRAGKLLTGGGGGKSPYERARDELQKAQDAGAAEDVIERLRAKVAKLRKEVLDAI